VKLKIYKFSKIMRLKSKNDVLINHVLDNVQLCKLKNSIHDKIDFTVYIGILFFGKMLNKAEAYN